MSQTLMQAVMEERAQIREFQEKLLTYPLKKKEAREAIYQRQQELKEAQRVCADLDAQLNEEIVADPKTYSNEAKRKAGLDTLRKANPNYAEAARVARAAEGAYEQAKLELLHLEEACKVVRCCLEGSVANQLAYSTPKILMLSEVTH